MAHVAALVPLLAIALIPLLAWTDHARQGERAGQGTMAWLLVLGAAALIGVIVLPGEGVTLSLTGNWLAGGFGLRLDRITLAMALLIGLVGAAATAYSGRQLVGDVGRPAFMRALALTIASALVLALSSNLLQIALCWLVVSAGLHRLLLHHGQRSGAVLTARHKFLVSRIGDLGMVVAVVSLLPAFGTLDLGALAAAAASASPGQHAALTWAACGLALAAIAKSAQFPLHAWLPQTLEAPTAVSALMHAGIINGGGFLLIRCSEILVHVPSVLTVLAVIGTLTAILGVLAMWAQTDIKKALAWSTVAQMGFMILECGLGAFAAALLHLLGHGCYKAHAFLRSGSVAPALMTAAPINTSAARAAGIWVCALAIATALVWLAHRAMGGVPWAAPGGVLLSLVIVLAAAQLLIAPVPGARWRGLAGCAALIVVAIPGLHMVHLFLEPLLGKVADLTARGAAGTAIAVLIGAALIGLATLGVLLPNLGRVRWAQALRIHASQGFYLGIHAERAVRSLWPLATPTTPGDRS